MQCSFDCISGGGMRDRKRDSDSGVGVSVCVSCVSVEVLVLFSVSRCLVWVVYPTDKHRISYKTKLNYTFVLNLLLLLLIKFLLNSMQCSQLFKISKSVSGGEKKSI